MGVKLSHTYKEKIEQASNYLIKNMFLLRIIIDRLSCNSSKIKLELRLCSKHSPVKSENCHDRIPTRKSKRRKKG